MAQLRRDYPQFVEHRAEVVVLGPDGAVDFRRFWTEREMPFVGLSDAEHAVGDLYGLEVSFLKLGRMPALFVVDRDGRIAFSHYARSMSNIPTSATVLAALGGAAPGQP
jgi:peroxiredoxin